MHGVHYEMVLVRWVCCSLCRYVHQFKYIKREFQRLATSFKQGIAFFFKPGDLSRCLMRLEGC